MEKKTKNTTLYLTQGAMIAALYVVLTMIANAFGLASMAIQVRFSEALTILPYFTPAAIPGLFAGCLLSNLMTGHHHLPLPKRRPGHKGNPPCRRDQNPLWVRWPGEPDPFPGPAGQKDQVGLRRGRPAAPP